mgnify:CR=1 FL=1
MSYHVEAVVFPHPGVRAAATQNRDESISFYVSAHLPEEARKEAVEELAERIMKEATP